MQRSKSELFGALAFAGSGLVYLLTRPWAYGGDAPPPEPVPDPVVQVEPVVTPQAQEPPVIDIVFVLDTTGSMSGLLEGAKKKIWSIANNIASGEPRPEVRVGLVAYRDRGDTYVTQSTPLTKDLDEVYSELVQLQATGGGDFPEDVNQGLRVALRETGWSTREDVLKMVYLVGDAPPHDDYDPKMTSTILAAEAKARGILLHTVQCGNNPQTAKSFAALSNAGGGAYMTIAAHGGMSVVATPFDEQLAALNRSLADLALDYGSAESKRRGGAKKARRKAMPAAAAADVASYGGKAGRMYGEDLVTALKDGSVALGTLTPEELPSELQGKSKKAQRAIIEANKAERAELLKHINSLSERRDSFLKKKAAEEGADESFDAKVLDSVREHAKKIGVSY
ncbi:MAG: vWA domain-containing protein [Nannocystaceae bacterium]